MPLKQRLQDIVIGQVVPQGIEGLGQGQPGEKIEGVSDGLDRVRTRWQDHWQSSVTIPAMMLRTVQDVQRGGLALPETRQHQRVPVSERFALIAELEAQLFQSNRRPIAE